MLSSALSRSLALGTLLVGTQACSDLPSAVPAAEPRRSVIQSADPADPLLRMLAAALSDPQIRLRLLADLRDSPFPKHRLHLKSYLRGRAGAPILASGAERAGTTPGRIMRLLDSLPEVEIVMPTELDRIRWTGTPDVVVVGSGLPRREIHSRGSLVGYTTRGEPVTVPLYTPAGRPLILLIATRENFGNAPEERRLRAPRTTRRTVSTPELEMSATSCDPATAVIECVDEHGSAGPITYAGGGVQLSSGYTYQCMVGAYAPGDGDGDTVLDVCERELAQRFRPYLALRARDYWYSIAGDDDVRREEHWAARTGDFANSVKIFYALSYYKDMGDPTCLGCTGHDGDSEWVNLHLFYANGLWYVDRARLSAHWHALAESTETVDAQNLEFPGEPGRIRVWVAEYKHANYKSKHACNNGGALDQDDCSDNSFVLGSAFFEVEVLPDANLGNSWHQYKNCVPSRKSVSPYQECYWNPGVRFKGWSHYRYRDDAGPYHEPLTAYSY